MNYHFKRLASKTLCGVCLALVCGGFTACKDDYDLDDEGNYPSWLGGSIYEALKNPTSLNGTGSSKLTGTFKNYVRLIDDLGEAETLGKTGSKTIFPANDEAFERFLTDDMKKRLLYSSTLDNALLVEMLSNISNGSTAVLRGQALRHYTSINLINTIQKWNKDSMPSNNKYWEKYYDDGIYVVTDATSPMMIHFTEEQMTANSITTKGDDSDFEILTGSKYDADAHSAYIFRNKIIAPDITCKNGYIHQMQDVLIPPGNLGEVIRSGSNSKLWSRMLDRFCAPYVTNFSNKVTENYNNYAQLHGLPKISQVYDVDYFSSMSTSRDISIDPDGNALSESEMLPYDPGWNEYNTGDVSTDVAAMFVPTDKALQEFFLPGGEGEFLINAFGKKENTVENLEENIDSIPIQNAKQLIANLMQKSFISTVPSKFGHVMDEANDPMGLTIDVINRNSDDNTYDVKIANNGVVYMLNKMFAPPSLIAVSAPVTLNNNMRIMNVAVHDGKGNSKPLDLGLNFYAYLLAMSANYAFFIPTDEAFGKFYVDPTYLDDNEPRALRFYYKYPKVYCSAWKYDKATGMVGDSIKEVATSDFRTQFIDILNYHTVVLGQGQTLGDNGNKYYKTKHGAGIVFDGTSVKTGNVTVNGEQIVPKVQKELNHKNGTSYEIDQVIQAPQQSVLNVIQNHSQFSEFNKLCNWHFDNEEEGFTVDQLMNFASDKLVETNKVTNKKRYEAYQTFVSKGGLTYNVNYFSSYNYTVYAPDNTAMQKAYDLGLPTWNDVKKLYDQYNATYEAEKEAGTISQEVQDARDKALAMIYEINNFIRYHFQDNSVFADKVIEEGEYPTACSDSLGIRQKLTVTGGNDMITLKDVSQNTIDINTELCNQFTRDYVLDKKNHRISTSSFAVVHQISTPLNNHSVSQDESRNVTDNARYDFNWAGLNAASRLKAFRRQFETRLYRQYDSE